MTILTKKLIDALVAADTDYVVWDDKLPGFGIKITPAGKKSYIYKYRAPNGVQHKPNIGQHGKITCEEARTIVCKWEGMLADGIDPQKAKREAKDELTFGDLFAVYIERHSKPHKKTWQYDEAGYRRHIEPTLGSKKLSDITQEDIHRLHQRIAENGRKSIANHMLSLITAVFHKGVEWKYTKEIPSKYIRKFKERSRERFLTQDEMPRFIEALEKEENPDQRDFIYLLLFTGARKGNVLAMRWQDLDVSGGKWHIPLTKNGDSHTVPLVPEALEILKRRRENAEKKAEWVFAGPGEQGHLIEPKRAWRRLLASSGLKGVTMHDLRRTMGSWQIMTGSNSTIVGKSLGHKDSKSTLVYTRLTLDPVRLSMGNAVTAMGKAAKEQQGQEEKKYMALFGQVETGGYQVTIPDMESLTIRDMSFEGAKQKARNIVSSILSEYKLAGKPLPSAATKDMPMDIPAHIMGSFWLEVRV